MLFDGQELKDLLDGVLLHEDYQIMHESDWKISGNTASREVTFRYKSNYFIIKDTRAVLPYGIDYCTLPKIVLCPTA